jgi:hypothetical protein
VPESGALADGYRYLWFPDLRLPGCALSALSVNKSTVRPPSASFARPAIGTGEPGPCVPEVGDRVDAPIAPRPFRVGRGLGICLAETMEPPEELRWGKRGTCALGLLVSAHPTTSRAGTGA